MVGVSRRLLLAAGIGLLLTIWYLFGQPDPYARLRPQVSPQQAELLAQQALEKVGLPKEVPLKWQVTQIENTKVEKYLLQHGLMDAFLQGSGKAEPLVVWQLVSAKDPRQEVWVNQQTGRIEAMQGFRLQAFPLTKGAEASGISSLLMEGFHCRLDSNFLNQSERDKTLTICGTDFSFHGIQAGIVGVQKDGWLTGFTHLVVVPGESLTNDLASGSSSGQGVASVAGRFNLYVLAFPLLGLFVFFFRPRVLTGMRWKTAVAAGLLTMLGVWLQAGTVEGFAQGLLYGAAVLVLVQIVYGGHSDLKALLCTPGWVRSRVWQGYCLFAMQAGVSVLFTWVATQFGAWMSPAQGKEMILLSRWPLLLPLATGFSAAIFEELVFRKSADRWLRRWIHSTRGIALISSLLWSVGHLGYDVDPWYLRIMELGLIAGPLSYWMYRKYGLFATVLAHFLYNLFVTCHDLVSVFGAGISIVYLYLFTPCLLLLRFGRKRA